MKKVVKFSIRGVLVTISLFVFVAVFVSAMKGITAHDYHMNFTQMLSDNTLRDHALIEKSTPSQFITNILLGVIPLFLIFAGMASSHILFKKYNLSLDRLGLFVTYTAIMVSTILMCLFGYMALSENMLAKLLGSTLIGGNFYMLFRSFLGLGYSSAKGNLTPERSRTRKARLEVHQK